MPQTSIGRLACLNLLNTLFFLFLSIFSYIFLCPFAFLSACLNAFLSYSVGDSSFFLFICLFFLHLSNYLAHPKFFLSFNAPLASPSLRLWLSLSLFHCLFDNLSLSANSLFLLSVYVTLSLPMSLFPLSDT